MDEEEPVGSGERRSVRSDHAAVAFDAKEVRVHLGREQGAGHQDAGMDLAEHALAQDARVHQPERELALRAWEDEAENPLVLVPPSDQELRDGRERRRHAASHRVLSRERDHLDEVRVPEGPAAAFP